MLRAVRSLGMVVVVMLGGCGIGVGAMSAANRPLFGQRIVDDERTAEYCSYGTIGELDAEECYIRDESGLSKLGRYAGVVGDWRRRAGRPLGAAVGAHEVFAIGVHVALRTLRAAGCVVHVAFYAHHIVETSS